MSAKASLEAQQKHAQLKEFAGISLSELDSRAELLERMDQKYIVNSAVLDKALEHLSPHFNILDINGSRSFHYDNCYFDDTNFNCYHQHQQDRRTRFKVRTRRYTDSKHCFVEIKLKGPRGRTIKKRSPCSPKRFAMLDKDSREFIAKAYAEIYGQQFNFELIPSIQISFYRSTLAAMDEQERITIDTHLQFSSGNKVISIAPELAIIETKSANRNGLAIKILRGLHQHPVSSCSKYCVGMALLGKAERYNRFLSAMRKLQLIPTQLQHKMTLEKSNNESKLIQYKHFSEQAHVAKY